MAGDELELRVAWQTHVADDLAPLGAVLARHREPHRRYHTVDHVAWVIRHVRELVAGLASDGVAPPLDPGAIVAAAFFHDAVYDPTSPPGHDETASAELARRRLDALGWEPRRIDHVASMIEATIDHRGSHDLDTAILCDADLAVLGAPPAAYREYAAQVRAEYAHVDDVGWRTGRRRVLEGFLARPTVFTTEPAIARWEERSRANLAAELATLR